jgi:hypothetical protein
MAGWRAVLTAFLLAAATTGAQAAEFLVDIRSALYSQTGPSTFDVYSADANFKVGTVRSGSFSGTLAPRVGLSAPEGGGNILLRDGTQVAIVPFGKTFITSGDKKTKAGMPASAIIEAGMAQNPPTIPLTGRNAQSAADFNALKARTARPATAATKQQSAPAR